ncbi:hypothetical protein [Streptomyces griseofuscus]|nr:hypothetical protein [Streptomyces griseofuscus]
MKPVKAEWPAPVRREAAPEDDARAAVIYIRHHYLPIGRSGSYT